MPTDPFDALRGMEFQTREEAMNWIDDNVRPSGFLNGTYEVPSVLNFLESRIRPRLQPCPFCGSTTIHVQAQIHEHKDLRGLEPQWRKETRYIGQCVGCDAAGPHRKTQDGAVAAWNDRPKH